MHWYHYLSSFFAGIFLGNFVPHFIKGVAGDPFPILFRILLAKVCRLRW